MERRQVELENEKKNLAEVKSLTNDANFHTTDFQHQLLDLKSQNEELSSFNKKFLERENQYKETIERKMNEIKELKQDISMQLKVKTEESALHETKIKDLERLVLEQSKYQTQLDSCKKLLSSQKQTFEKQVDLLKKRLAETEDQHHHHQQYVQAQIGGPKRIGSAMFPSTTSSSSSSSSTSGRKPLPF
ncbi:hypothetical protein SAMD00019534_002830 [Acytostelium subglobosum LB1]|uniref:hypothetical protein n=1 Tax=Acytostelium subglobosum LB1 TaxID=1410327 RepID=UPI000644903B|nr:hypothetical protein SAMD00019534_002830 [Acytostelium subglobosum LB1]GAM17108.1 hypothetical protein SAMD00019534_002830 [Acytostelium subglobosum LB1]|eukprot:XP_012759170.1 hypothetical protein SAMD00019534_002830 [Acytostelium subglobosum LB1]